MSGDGTCSFLDEPLDHPVPIPQVDGGESEGKDDRKYLTSEAATESSTSLMMERVRRGENKGGREGGREGGRTLTEHGMM